MKNRLQNGNGRDPVARAMTGARDLTAQVAVLTQHVTHLQAEVAKLRQATSPKAVKAIAREQYAEEDARLSKLRNDAIGVLRLLVARGVVTNDEIREATGG